MGEPGRAHASPTTHAMVVQERTEAVCAPARRLLVSAPVRKLRRLTMAVTGATVIAVSGARAASLGTVAASDLTCRARQPSLQMTVDTSEVRDTLPAQRVRDATSTMPDASPAGAETKNRFGLNGQKYASPVGS